MQVVADLSKVGYMIIVETDNIQEMSEVNKFARLAKQKVYLGDPSAQNVFKYKVGQKVSGKREAYHLKGQTKLIRVEGE